MGGGLLLSGVVTEGGGPGLLYWGSGLSEFYVISQRKCCG